jgi:hypothetical protein
MQLSQTRRSFKRAGYVRGSPEQRVRVTGTLFDAISGHHHTNVLVSPTKIERT